jgi:hypothetical protein
MKQHWHCPACGGVAYAKGLCADCWADGKSLAGTASEIRRLRDIAGCGLIEARSALNATFGDIVAAEAMIRYGGQR